MLSNAELGVSRTNGESVTRGQRAPLVHCHNGWDPLEEVIVGRMDASCVPPWHEAVRATMPEHHWDFFRTHGGRPFSAQEIDAANRNLDALAEILARAGVRVHRPDIVDHGRPFETPHWRSESGLYSAMPRDVAMVVGDTIVEAAMSWRSRYHEVEAFRSLFLEYFNAGAKWISPPKPLLKDSLYRSDSEYGQPVGGRFRSMLNETEIVFDAADFLLCGRDVLYFESHTTNRLGVSWLERALGDQYRLVELDCDDGHRMHIDTTYLPLAPGKMLVNPDRVKEKPAALRRWDFLPAPTPCTPDETPLYMSGKWLSMNILMLNETTAVVAEHERTLMRALKDWGIDSIPCPFVDFYRFGGSIHCATLDIRRRGDLSSYL